MERRARTGASLPRVERREQTVVSIVMLGIVSGSLIGALGVGGVLLAPVLAYVLGYNLQSAQAAASFSFIFTGVVGTASYAKERSIDWRLVKWMSVGLIPGAFLGALTNSLLPTSLLAAALALLLLFAGRRAFARPDQSERCGSEFHWRAQLIMGLGLAVGFGSALTGTGGPVILVPTLTALGVPPLLAVGGSQASQIPIAAFATVSFATFGKLDIALGLVLGVSQAVGVLAGASVAHRTPQAVLSRVVSGAVFGAGLLLAGQVIATSFL